MTDDDGGKKKQKPYPYVRTRALENKIIRKKLWWMIGAATHNRKHKKKKLA